MNEQDKRTSLLTLAGDGLLLLCALLGLAGSFLSLYGDGLLGSAGALPATPLDLCAAQEGDFLLLAALFGLASLAAWSLPRFRWAAVGGLLLLWDLCCFSSWERLRQGMGITARTVTEIFSRRVSWGTVLRYDPGLTQTEEGAAARLFLTLALALLALILGWAVVRARRWWAVALFTLPPLLPGLLADLYPGWPAFMALCACWCVMLLTDLCKWAAPDRRGALTLAVLPCVAVVLAVITLAFPREGYTRPEWARSMEAELYNGSSRLAEFFSQFDGPFQRRITYVGSAEEADLTSAGPLDYIGRTVLRVRSDYSGRLYLRGSSLAVYENGVWRALPDEVFEGAAGWGGSLGGPIRVLFFPAMSAGHGPEHTVTVDNVGAVGNCVYAPYFPTVQDLEGNGMAMVNDSLLARQQGRWTHTISFVELAEPHPRQAVEVMPTKVQAGGANFGPYPGLVYEHYLDVPEEYREDLVRFCMNHDIYSAYLDGNDASDPVDTARQIAALLDQYYEYDQTVEAPPEGEDPVYYFLLESHRGYCMHFASAATLMLRSLGIPARYVSGFTVESVAGQSMAVPDRAAHAWVEVWVNGFGWYPVEVTPAAAFAWYEQEDADLEDIPSDPAPESEAPEPTPTPSQGPAPSPQPSAAQEGENGEPEDGSGRMALFGAVKVLAVMAGTAALLWLGQYLAKRSRSKRLSSPDRNRAALDAYGYLRRMERWGGSVDERAVELAQKARFSRHILTREELDELRGRVDAQRARLCAVLGPAARLAFRYAWGRPASPKSGENAENDRKNRG